MVIEIVGFVTLSALSMEYSQVDSMDNTEQGHDSAEEDETSTLQLSAIRSLFNVGFTRVVDFDFLILNKDYIELGLSINKHYLNTSGTIHGGVLMTLMDVAGSCSGNYIKGYCHKVLTLTLTSTFTGQTDSGYIYAIARRRSRGRNIFNSSMEIVDSNRKLLAMGQGTYRLLSDMLKKPDESYDASGNLSEEL